MPSRVSQILKLIKECPACRTKYTEKEIKIVEIDNDKGEILAHFNCPVCFSSLLARVMEMPFGIFGSAALTDLAADEIKKFINGEKVNYDDVLEVYEKLGSNRGIK